MENTNDDLRQEYADFCARVNLNTMQIAGMILAGRYDKAGEAALFCLVQRGHNASRC